MGNDWRIEFDKAFQGDICVGNADYNQEFHDGIKTFIKIENVSVN